MSCASAPRRANSRRPSAATCAPAATIAWSLADGGERMSDIRPGDSEALPWLEAVEDEDEAPAVSARKMLAALALVLIGVAIVAGALFWLGRQDTGSGPPVLI